MAANKEAYIRYRIIDRLLRGGKLASKEDIIYACKMQNIDIKERRIGDDISDMQEDERLGWNAPIISVGNKMYTYSDENFSINDLPITDDEIESLRYAGHLLNQFNNMAPFDKLNGAIKKIFKHVEIRNELSGEEFSKIVDIESSPETFGLEHITKLITAIKEKKVLEIKHRSFRTGKEHDYTLHPYLLKEYRNRFYIFGYCEDFEKLSIFGLDRIVGIKNKYGIRYKRSNTDPIDYFKNVIGVTKFENTIPETVILRFSQHQAPYIRTQEIHSSQDIKENSDGTITVTLKVHNSPELQIILLGWNENVEVLAPDTLRNDIKKMIEGAAELYGIV